MLKISPELIVFMVNTELDFGIISEANAPTAHATAAKRI
jgi:hypothetical protein